MTSLGNHDDEFGSLLVIYKILLLGILFSGFRHKTAAAAVSPQGIVLACLSNVCFCVWPFFMKRLQQQLQGTNSTAAKDNDDDDDAKIFFNVTLLASLVLPCLVVTTGELHHVDYDDDVFWKKDSSSTTTTTTPLLLFKNILWSSFFFFGYQWTQLKVMSVLSPLVFSILTPFE